MSSVASQKRAFRAACKARRAALGEAYRAQANAALATRIEALQAFCDAEIVFTYLSFGDEVDTRRIIEMAWDAHKTVALPYCVPKTRNMRWFRVTSFEGLRKSRLGVSEPVPNQASEIAVGMSQRTIAFVPGLAFDRACYRMGYGGGFYDTFLADYGATSVGLCYDALMQDDLGAHGVIEPHDRPVQQVLTESRAFIQSGMRLEQGAGQ